MHVGDSSVTIKTDRDPYETIEKWLDRHREAVLNAAR